MEMVLMKKEPDIVKELRNQEKLGLLKGQTPTNFKGLKPLEIIKYHDSIDNNIVSQDCREIENTNHTNEKIYRQLELINSLNYRANHGASLKEIISIINEKTAKLFSSNGASIYLLSEDRRFLNLKNINIKKSQEKQIEKLIGKNIQSIKIPLTENSYYSKLLEVQKPCIINDHKIISTLASECTSNKIIKKLIHNIFKIIDIKSVMFVPLIFNNELLGLIDISRNSAFDENELKTFETISGHLSVILKRKISEERLQNIIKHSDEVYYIHDINQNLSYVSPQCEKIFGYTSEEMMIKWTSIITDNPMNEIGLEKTNKAIVTGEKQDNYFLEAIRKDGEKIIVKINESPIKDENGIVVGITGSVKDVTETWKSNEQLNILSIVMEQSPNSIGILDDKGIVKYVNPKLLEIYELKREDVIGKNWESWVSKESDLRKNISDIKETVLEKGMTWTGEVSDSDKNGNLLWREATISPIKDKNSNIVNIAYISRDITDRKKIENVLKDSKNHFQNLFNNLVDPAVIVDSKGVFLDITKKVEELTGYKREDLLGKNFLRTKLLTSKSKRLLIKNLVKRMAGMHIPPYTINVLTKDGIILPCELNAEKIDYMGKTADMVIFRDIRERKKFEKAIKENEEKFRNIFENASDGIIYLDKSGKILDVNNKAIEFFGGAKSELIGQDFTKLNIFNPGDIPKLMTNLVKILRHKYTSLEIKIKNKLGIEIYLDCSVKSMKLADGKSAILVIARDVTERIKVQEKDRFVKNIFKGIQDGISIIDPDLNIIMTNEWIEKRHKDKTPIIGKKCYKVYQNRDSVCPWCPTIKTIKTGESLTEVVSVDFPEGGSWDCQLSTYPYYDENGNIKGAIEFVKDVTELKSIQKKLSESEEIYKLLFNSINDSILILDYKHNKFMDVNKIACNRYGYTYEEFINMSPSDLDCTNDTKKIKERIEKTIKEKKNIFEVVHKSKSGEKLYIEVNARLISYKGKSVIIAVNRDITERKQNEEILKQSEEKYRTIFENVNDAIAYFDEFGNILDVNSRNEELFGRKKEKIIGKNFLKIGLFQQEDIPRVIDLYKDLVKKGKPAINVELDILHNDGNIINTELNTRVIKKEGKNFGFLSMIRDVTEQKKARDKIKESEERYNSLFNRSLLWVYIHDFNGNFIDANKTALDSLGYKREDIKTLNFTDILYDEDIKKANEITKEIIENGFQKKPEIYKIKTKSGEIKIVEVEGHLLYRDNKPYAVQGVARDITQQKNMEIKLIDSEERLRILFENAPDAIYTNDLKGNFIEGNKVAEKLTGYKKEELIGKSLVNLNLLQKSQIPKAIKLLSKNALGKPTGPDDFVLINKYGKKIPIEISTFPVKIKKKKIVLGIARDISERKRAEDKFKILFETSRDSIMTLEPPSWKFKSANRSTLELFNANNENEFTSKCFWDVSPNIQSDGSPSSKKAKMMINKAMNEGSNFFEWTHRTLNGKKFPATVLLTRVDIEEGKPFLQATIRDISEQKKAEEKIKKQNIKMKKLDKIKSDFLNITSHELRTPMSAIKGYIQMIIDKTLGDINEEQINALKVVLRNSNRLDNLIQDILDLSRLESGTLKFIAESSDIKQLAKDAIETMQSFALSKNMKIEAHIEDNIPKMKIDQERIKQVLINLLNNAIKFSPNGSTINIRVKKQKKDVLFEIQDFGRGIPMIKQSKIFDTFYQVEGGMDRKFGGAGLGLSISRGIVLAHGGKIYLESAEGKGSTFSFTIPKKPVENMEGRFKEVDIFKLENNNDIKKRYKEKNTYRNGV